VGLGKQIPTPTRRSLVRTTLVNGSELISFLWAPVIPGLTIHANYLGQIDPEVSIASIIVLDHGRVLAWAAYGVPWVI
jgi:hypothetical protein